MADSQSLVFGASGNIGYGVARAILAKGGRVVLPTRSAESAARLEADFPGEQARIVIGDVSSAAGARELRAAIEPTSLQHVIVSVGGWWQGGRLADQSIEEYEPVRAMLLDAHVYAALAFLPGLVSRDGTSYTIITGQAAITPPPGTSLLAVATAGVQSLSRTLRAEHARDAVRVNEVLIQTRVERVERNGVVPAEAFGRAVVALLESDTRGAVLPFRSPDTFSPRP
jgi:3-oxoacyl-[acyl-carrier protein] reductase